jgi:hypothetical protein
MSAVSSGDWIWYKWTHFVLLAHAWLYFTVTREQGEVRTAISHCGSVVTMSKLADLQDRWMTEGEKMGLEVSELQFGGIQGCVDLMCLLVCPFECMCMCVCVCVCVFVCVCVTYGTVDLFSGRSSSTGGSAVWEGSSGRVV